MIGNQVEATLFQMKILASEAHKQIVDHEKTSLADLASQEKLLYCLVDTELDQNLKDLELIERHLTQKNTVLGDIELYGEGIVSQKNMRTGEGAKYFRYDNYNPYRLLYQEKKVMSSEIFAIIFLNNHNSCLATKKTASKCVRLTYCL